MTEDELRRMALCLLADYDGGTPRERFSLASDLTIPQAYQLQGMIARLREQRGERIIGYKIGCTSKPIQEQLGVGEPIWGRIFDTGCFPSGVRLSHQRYANLAVEGELAVRLSKDLRGAPLPPHPTLSPRGGEGRVWGEEILAAIEAVFPVIELHQYLLQESRSPGPELIAHNGMHAGLVLADVGPASRAGPVPLGSRDLPPACGAAATCSQPESVRGLNIRINDAVAGSAAQPWTMAGPVESLRWLAARLAEFGLRLERGQTILTGSPMPLFPVRPGMRIVVEAPPLGRSCAVVGP